MSEFRKAYVYNYGLFAGEIAEVEDGFTFAYDQEYLLGEDAAPVSLTLPLSREPYTASVLFPFFDGLIPEGWLLNLVTKNWKLNPKDRFGVLMVACSDCIGSVSVRGEKS